MSLTSRRYLIVIINGTKNPHRSAVAKDITDAILKTHATDGKPAAYWSKGEQECQLEAAYEKWLKHGKVWSVAASNVSQARAVHPAHCHSCSLEQTHHEQLTHVRKGCLARTRHDISTDGSRIEASHKGWNSLQRSFACGIVLIVALAHDAQLYMASRFDHYRANTIATQATSPCAGRMARKQVLDGTDHDRL